MIHRSDYICLWCILITSGASSDLAYETMYDDDEILDQKQTMPWFDPNYLAAKEEDEVLYTAPLVLCDFIAYILSKF